MAITHLLTKDTCNSCKGDYLGSESWISGICPSCVISKLEDSTDLEWMANIDPPVMNIESYNRINADEFYHVVTDKNSRYRLVTHRNLMIRPWKFGKIHYSNKLESCVEWIKKRKK